MKKGFTLIELLVVIMVLSFVGAIVVAIIVSTLQGTQKSTSLTEVRQSGNHTISVISRMIRNSQRVNLCADNRIDITNPDSGRTVFSCDSSTISSNSASFFPQGVVVTSCSIACLLVQGSSTQTVTISFTASTASLGLQRVSIPFQTSIQTRN